MSLPDFWNHSNDVFLKKATGNLKVFCVFELFFQSETTRLKKKNIKIKKILWECTVPNTVVIKKTALRRVNHKWNCTVFYPPKKEGNNWIIPELLLMVQKSSDHHLACTKPIVNNGINTTKLVNAGFQNHQQYFYPQNLTKQKKSGYIRHPSQKIYSWHLGEPTEHKGGTAGVFVLGSLFNKKKWIWLWLTSLGFCSGVFGKKTHGCFRK